MSGTGLGRLIYGLFGKKPPVALKNTPKELFYTESDPTKNNSAADRWWWIGAAADLRPDDSVLDAGCAEGLLTMETARRVARVEAFDYSSMRIEHARRTAVARGIKNIEFSVLDIHDASYAPSTFDVVMFLSVYGLVSDRGRIGPEHLRMLARAAKRQIVLRLNVQDCPNGDGLLTEIFDTLASEGFEAICFPRDGKYDNMIIANRIGAGGRIAAIHQLLVIPSSYAGRRLPDLSGVPVLPWKVHDAAQ